MVQTILRLTGDSRTRTELVQALRTLARSARIEPGYMSSQICRDDENPNTFYYQEEWSTAEALEKQIRSPRYSNLLALMETSKTAPRLEFRFISEIRGLGYVEAIRFASEREILPEDTENRPKKNGHPPP